MIQETDDGFSVFGIASLEVYVSQELNRGRNKGEHQNHRTLCIRTSDGAKIRISLHGEISKIDVFENKISHHIPYETIETTTYKTVKSRG